ncbi:hypothetical protein O181_083437 [Austropuccinia psidii MF-1]|uniref:Intradiol ring-cleavage dioxygenases domain-containing protein n=1 Tax=Austropuccinia psidii MF-1 TaxID=1389203 RepID=A0A9Q3FUF5_9BASI|nr:hypothetical protein [Austropuccinia psidii MF-1]
MDIGVIDVESCKPVRGALVDLWHANATGFYAGHPSPSPELINEKPQVGGRRSGLLTAYPRTNFDEQWCRGAWPTDDDGVARFSSIFPGYYTGRATHVHAQVHLNWKVNPNSTFISPHAAYVGQFFFEDEINLEIDKMSPYNQNPVKDRTRNWRDSLTVYHESHQNGFQATFDIEKVGTVIRQGLIGYMTVGINLSAQFDHHWSPVEPFP